MNADSAIIRLSTTSNAVVVQLPERKLPGVVVQGDSLANLQGLLDEASRRLVEGNTSEAADLVTEAGDIVASYVASYEAATTGVAR